MKYPKINSLWKRDLKTKKFIEDEHSQEEFAVIKKWQVQEKIDGTNIRVHAFTKNISELFEPLPEPMWVIKTTFHGRNEDSMIPANLMPVLQHIFKDGNIHGL